MNENFWKYDDELWLALASEGKFALIEKLQKAFNRVPGFGTIVVTKEGFSENDRTHNMVIRSLKEHGVNICDVLFEIGNLERALCGNREV
jgi:hypothetical protein